MTKQNAFVGWSLVGVVVMGSVAVYAACAGDAPRVRTPQVEVQKAASPDVTPPVPVDQGLSSEQTPFPLPIWRNVELTDLRNFAGVLLRTTEGSIQVKRLVWSLDEEGHLYICYLTAYTRDGELVSFGSSDGCKPPQTKEAFEGTLLTASGGVIDSFDFATNREGYLAFTNLVEVVDTGRDDASCGFTEVIVCVSEGCSGTCGLEASMLDVRAVRGQPSFGGLSFSADGDVYNCVCTGSTGSCRAVSRRQCEGECGEGRSCVMVQGGRDGRTSCDCRS